LIKVWDLQRQCCLGTYSDPSMSKVNDFSLVGELGLLVTASVDGTLRLFQIIVAGEKSEENAEEEKKNGEEDGVSLKYVSSFLKESSQRATQMSYDRKRQLLVVLSSDNKLELFKVNVNKPDAILKKLIRQEKKRATKRNHSEMEDEEAAEKKTVDKKLLAERIANKDYDLSLHFSRKMTIELDPSSKAKSFSLLAKDKTDLTSIKILVAFHSNVIMQYKVEVSKESQSSQVLSQYGELSSHKTPIRGISMAPNDQLFATNSFDSVKVWSVDLFMYSKKNSLDIRAKQSLEEPNVLSLCILPGNKYIVCGTKEGQLLLYDLNTNAIINRL